MKKRTVLLATPVIAFAFGLLFASCDLTGENAGKSGPGANQVVKSFVIEQTVPFERR